MTSAPLPLLSAVIEKLIEKTAGRRTRWRVGTDGFEAPLPTGTAVVGRSEDPAGNHLFLRLLTPTGEDVARIDSSAGGSEHDLLVRLHDTASRSAMSDYLSELYHALDRDEQLPPATPTELPKPITLDEERDLFGRIAGKWHLDYGKGREYVEISGTGLYSCGPRPTESRPKFQLHLVAVSPDRSTVELAKDFLDGRTLQIETLTLDRVVQPTRMDGEAKHDRHAVHYTRR
ncbi:MAG: hypothetical protein K2P78_14940 [Gemmataceae bacterium]|nr:hypothetical protein [Gemmataceae bacterium]